MILTLRTDKPEAEIGLYEDGERLDYQRWQAHRQLAETLHTKIHKMLKTQSKDWSDIAGIVVFKGPGSFTGLRIGITVANALSYSNHVPIVGAVGEDWLGNGLQMLGNDKDDHIVLPEYGSEVHITPQRK